MRLLSVSVMKRIFVSLCVLCFVCVDGQSSEGGKCTTRIGQSGECAKISACSAVRNELRKGIRNQIICGYDGSTRIICCPNVEVTTTTAEPVLDRISVEPVLDRISVKKCDEYNEFSFDKISLANTFGGGAIEDKVSNCAFTPVPLIVGGTEAKMREFPHMALIGFENDDRIEWDCSGTLISEQFVLGTAHCSDTRAYGPPKYVRLGEHDKSRTDDGTSIEIRIIERIPHPEYRYPIVYNDIALFKLERKVELNGAIRPACLPQVSAVSYKTAIASGWEVANKTSVLQKVVLNMFSQSECNTIFKSFTNRRLHKGIVEEAQVCTSFTCVDGPLQIYHHNHPCSYVIIGVPSFGSSCLRERRHAEYPDVYTRVYAYLNWIEQIVWPDQETTGSTQKQTLKND